MPQKMSKSENKENVNPTKKYFPQKPLKCCWTHGCNISHAGDDFFNPLPNHCEKATLDNNMGGSKVGINIVNQREIRNDGDGMLLVT